MTEQSTTSDIKDDVRFSPVMGKADVNEHGGNDFISAAAAEEHARFQQQLMQLRQQQQLQQQLLLQHFQQQQRQLAEQHERQLQQRVQEFLEQQKKLEEEHKQERERKEKERLEQLKNKEKHEYSAVASSEVKQSLQEFLLNKKQREAAAGNPPKNFKTWSRQHNSLEQASPPSSSLSPRCKHPILGKYDDDFPLRKTASEPNLKVRSVLKQKVLDRRSSPLLKSKDRGPIPSKRRPPPPPSVEGIPNRPESGPGSPQTAISLTSSHSSNGSTPIHEEAITPPLHPVSRACDVNLYSSPSMPNISLGLPHPPTMDGKQLSEMQVQFLTGRSGMPANSHILHSVLPFYPALPVVDGDSTQSLNLNYLHEMPMDQGSCSSLVSAMPAFMLSPGGVNSEVHLAHQQRSIQRPLGRTHSAPLPLGHPMLQHPSLSSTAQSNDRIVSDSQASQQHNLCKQHIRHTVLTRLSSKGQIENMSEDSSPDGPPGPQFKTISSPLEALPEVDLSDSKVKDAECECELAKQQRDREAFLQQQREIMCQHPLNASEVNNVTSRFPVPHPLSRALSSPLVTAGAPGSFQEASVSPKVNFTTGIAYDSIMLRHQCICGDNTHHPEHAGRLQSIWARLQETGLTARCDRVRPRKATLEEIQSCHSEIYTYLFGTNPLNRQKLDANKLAELPIKNFVMLPCGGIGVDSDTVWNELHTASAARMAVGCVLDLSFKVATGELKNGFALVRPPGHHAEYQQPMGFCYFNSVAIAAKLLRQRLKLEKILIVDWDVHHGNGLQQLFYDDPHILYISIHRHDDGNFFPGTGDPEEVGSDDGVGFNVNIALSGSLHPPMGNAEYLAAFRTIVMPIARDFDPEIVLVACGFDAAKGHAPPLGGYNVTPSCFAYMTKQLMQLAKGKVVMALEGGYDLPSVCDCTQECIAALLGDECSPMSEEEMQRRPCFLAKQVLHHTAVTQAPHWPCIKRWVHTIDLSFSEAQQKEKEEVDTVTALASLSMAASCTRKTNSSVDVTDSKEEEPMEEDNKK